MVDNSQPRGTKGQTLLRVIPLSGDPPRRRCRISSTRCPTARLPLHRPIPSQRFSSPPLKQGYYLLDREWHNWLHAICQFNFPYITYPRCSHLICYNPSPVVGSTALPVPADQPAGCLTMGESRTENKSIIK